MKIEDGIHLLCEVRAQIDPNMPDPESEGFDNYNAWLERKIDGMSNSDLIIAIGDVLSKK